MALFDLEARESRARSLDAAGLNGFRRVLVDSLATTPAPGEALLAVQFQNSRLLAGIAADVAGGTPPDGVFSIGGLRHATPVRVTDVQSATDPNFLRLTVRPIGDYSTYTLTLNHPEADPLFATIPFRFRPACFNTECDPAAARPARSAPQRIDYLAKDYDSFRHALIVALQERVAGWMPTSEADFTMVLIDLFSAAADELSDFQDRVANEAGVTRARGRISLARHARLMDYHIHQGNQATTWLALRVSDSPVAPFATVPLVAGLEAAVLTPTNRILVAFRSQVDHEVHSDLNSIDLYTWDGAKPGLAAGATSAELTMIDAARAVEIHDRIRGGVIRQLLVQEHLNPGTGQVSGRSPAKRQLLQLEVSDAAPKVGEDPLTNTPYLHVRWREADRLQHDYCFQIASSATQAAQFHGNLVQVYQGAQIVARFSEDGRLRDPALNVFAADTLLDPGAYSRIPSPAARPGAPVTGRTCTTAALPAKYPLLYRKTRYLPRGEAPAEATADLRVRRSDGGDDPGWEQTSTLVFSEGDEKHYMIETDELGRSFLRFGDGVNGQALPVGAEIHVAYQTGYGVDGNVGADRIRHCDHSGVLECWNPFDVTDGRAAEPRDEIVRNVGEAFRARQFRAVHLSDYVARAEELPEVSRAAARYVWTGSWRAVRVTIDPAGSDELTLDVRRKVLRHLDAVRLIGEDVEVRAPEFVPLIIELTICVHPSFWPRDVRADLTAEFSAGFTARGDRGLFHPDEWTFDQDLRASQLIGRALAVPGVEHVTAVRMRRWDSVTPGFPDGDVIEAGPSEVIQVRNDPDHMELGMITFELRGGRQ